MPNAYVKIIDKNVFVRAESEFNTFLSMILTYALGIGEKNLLVNILSISGVWGSAPPTVRLILK